MVLSETKQIELPSVCMYSLLLSAIDIVVNASVRACGGNQLEVISTTNKKHSYCMYVFEIGQCRISKRECVFTNIQLYCFMICPTVQ